MNKIAWFCILVYLLGTAFEAVAITKDGGNAAASRKMKEDDHVRLEDYAPVDPSPSSKAVIPGPIEHNCPTNPYIPRPPPPRYTDDYP